MGGSNGKAHYTTDRRREHTAPFGAGEVDVRSGLIVIHGKNGRFVWNQQDAALMAELLDRAAPAMAQVLREAVVLSKAVGLSRRE